MLYLVPVLIGMPIGVPTPHLQATGLILTLSRGSMGGGNSQCDWDNFFAAMMLGSDPRGQALGFATFAQELGSKTEHGFVPNGIRVATSRPHNPRHCRTLPFFLLFFSLTSASPSYLSSTF